MFWIFEKEREKELKTNGEEFPYPVILAEHSIPPSSFLFNSNIQDCSEEARAACGNAGCPQTSGMEIMKE